VLCNDGLNAWVEELVGGPFSFDFGAFPFAYLR